MAMDENLAEAVRRHFAARGLAVEERRMFGGLCFMVDDKMCAGVSGERLMLRLDPETLPDMLTRPGCVPMDFTGRPLGSFVFVNPDGLPTDAILAEWLERALDFNPRAKRSARRKPAKPRA